MRRRADKPEDKAYWIFVNFRGKRFSQRVGRKAEAEAVAREFRKTLMLYDLEDRWRKKR